MLVDRRALRSRRASGYFADSLTVVNLDGVVNAACYEALTRKLHWSYIRSAGVQHIVWQDDIALIARESRGFRPEHLAWVEDVPGVRTWGERWNVYRVERRTMSNRIRAGTSDPP